MLDGVYVNHPDTGQPTFVAVDPPTDEQLQGLVEQAAYRLIAVLERHGVLDDTQTDPLADDSPLPAGVTAASIQGRTAPGERAGRRLPSEFRKTFACPPANSEGHSLSPRLLTDPAEGLRTAPLCVAARGFSLHAATTVAAHDRQGLEPLCRNVNRPLACGRLQRLDAERHACAGRRIGGRAPPPLPKRTPGTPDPAA